jgi:hypothetical protein
VTKETTATAGCRYLLVVAGSAAEEVAEFVEFAAEAAGRIMLFEAAPQTRRLTSLSGRTSGPHSCHGLAQHRVDEFPVAIDRPIQVAPTAMELEVGFIDRCLSRAKRSARRSLRQRGKRKLTNAIVATPDRMIKP